jgi:hypothetical protein
MSILIRNGHLLAGERFEAWREAACQARLAPVEVHSDNQAGFRFALRYSDLGATRVSRFAVMPYQVRRTSKLIRQSDPERLSVGLLLHGHGIISQAGRQAHVPSGPSPCTTAASPTASASPAGGASAARALIVNFPRTLLPLPADKVKRLTAVTMPAGPGIGALTARLLVQLATGMDHYTPTEAARLSTAALDVLATRLAHDRGRVDPDAAAGELPAGSARSGAGHPPRRRDRGTLGVPQCDPLRPPVPRHLRRPATPISPDPQRVEAAVPVAGN